jgi:hypothetical protein
MHTFGSLLLGVGLYRIGKAAWAALKKKKTKKTLLHMKKKMINDCTQFCGGAVPLFLRRVTGYYIPKQLKCAAAAAVSPYFGRLYPTTPSAS